MCPNPHHAGVVPYGGQYHRFAYQHPVQGEDNVRSSHMFILLMHFISIALMEMALFLGSLPVMTPKYLLLLAVGMGISNVFPLLLPSLTTLDFLVLVLPPVPAEYVSAFLEYVYTFLVFGRDICIVSVAQYFDLYRPSHANSLEFGGLDD